MKNIHKGLISNTTYKEEGEDFLCPDISLLSINEYILFGKVIFCYVV